MRETKNECVGCTSLGLHCVPDCPYTHVTRLYCDKCGEETNELFAWQDDELCEDCLNKVVRAEGCDECGDEEVLFEHDGKMLCWICFCKALKVDE